MEFNIVEIMALALFVIAMLGLLWNRNIIKSIICIAIIEVSIIMFFMGINYQQGMTPPIGQSEGVADPVVQAIMITAIVIGIAVTAVALMMFITLYNRYGTSDWHKALKARSKER